MLQSMFSMKLLYVFISIVKKRKTVVSYRYIYVCVLMLRKRPKSYQKTGNTLGQSREGQQRLALMVLF